MLLSRKGKLRLRAFGVLGALLWAIACGSSRDSGGGTSAPKDLNPPDYIDLDVCGAIVDDESSFDAGASALDACRSCCDDHAFSASSFIHAGHCTCGNPPDSGGKEACADEIDTADACSACCKTANFTGHGWVGGVSCECFGLTDTAVCASALSQSKPDTACENCCIEQGFISMYYLGIGQRECACIWL